jgi:ribonuclease HI/exonuclease III
MPEHQTQDRDHTERHPTPLRIFQINLNKSQTAHLEVINIIESNKWDIVLVQEPHMISKFNAIRTPTNYRPVFPEDRGRNDKHIRSLIWVSTTLETKNWKIIGIPGTNDITAIQLNGRYGKLTIFNVYNDCTNANTENVLSTFLRDHANELLTHRSNMIWAGDFNRHHPLWDRDEDEHLFTSQATASANKLIALLADYSMTMALPKGIPTLEHMRSKNHSRPDNVFCTSDLQDQITRCDIDPNSRPPRTDHYPIVTHLALEQSRSPLTPNLNFRDVDWEVFHSTLKNALNDIPKPVPISTEDQLSRAAEDLTNTLRTTIGTCVKRSKPRPDAKRWWNRDLKKRRKELRKLRADSYRFRTLTDHPVHKERRELSNKYGNEIQIAKRQHWANYLEEMGANDIWTANKYLSNPVGDGGSPRIPTLRSTNANGETTEVNDNQSKAALFAKTFFPPPPPENTRTPPEHDYPAPLPDPPPITQNQIERHIRRLSPYKAYGPDEIPNIVLQKCADLITDYLLHIYRAVVKLGKYHASWRDFVTVVLRKPGKPNYETPKAYRPIALLSTIAKVLTAIVAEDISRLAEQHQLLPKNHFGGRPGRSTTDAIHYTIQRIKEAWRRNKVVSLLFLDVEGAFPNAVTKRLIHNLRKRRIPKAYVQFIEQLLTGRQTRLKFDDFVSEPIKILNGIGQGDPLSMILYILYNSDLLEITGDPGKEDAVGFVDDIAIMAIGDDFDETTKRIARLMSKEDGGIQWSQDHNSKFETSKSVILHATRRTQRDPEDDNKRIRLDRPKLRLQGKVIKEVQSYKYLGVQIDAQLRWSEQSQRTTANATKWLLQFRRLTRPSTGVGSKLMRRLYLAVALPKIAYGLDIWYSPPTKQAGAVRNTGSVGVLKSLQKLQRIATLAITGALRSTPTDLLDAHAGVLPMELALLKVCHRATVRLLTLPHTHPLHSRITSAKRSPPSIHPGPLDNLVKIFGMGKTKMETISPVTDDPYVPPRFATRIFKTRDESIQHEKKDDADFKIFTDGSNHDGGVGAAAVMVRKGNSRPIKTLKAYMGTPMEHNSHEAEVVGGILAMWLISGTPETSRKRVSIYTDNQAFAIVANRPKATSGQYLLQDFASKANNSNARIEVKWISSHSGVLGNERADKMAKEAAEGRANGRADLPHILRRTLPINASASKQEQLERLKRRWREDWTSSPRRERIERIDDTFPFEGYRKRQYGLSREHASLLMQVRSRHLPLNAYLHKIKKAESKHCQACRIEPGDQTPAETIEHFIYNCDAYTDQRKTLIRTIGASGIALKDVMLRKKHMKALAQYITRTGRFKNEDRPLQRTQDQ